MKTLSGILLMLFLPSVVFGGNSFPWEAKNSISPNGRYELSWKEVARADSSKAAGIPPYELIFRNIQTNTTRSVAKFEGSVNVHWAPDSNHFAITYSWGSNVAFVRVYRSRGALNGIDPYDNIKAKLGKLPEVENDNHVYFHALRWRGNNRLWIRLFGHWDTYGAGRFDYYFEISLDGGARRLSQAEIEKVKEP